MESEKTRIVFPLDEVREAWGRREFTLSELAERVGRTMATVSRVLNGIHDPGHEGAKRYHEALQAIRAERAATPEKKEGSK